MASSRMPRREGLERDAMHDIEEAEWQSEHSFNFMITPYSQSFPRPNEMNFPTFTPYSYPDDVPEHYGEPPALVHDFSLAHSNRSIGEPYYTHPSHSSLANGYFQAQPRQLQPSATNTQRDLQPRPRSFPASASHRSERNIEPARQIDQPPVAPQPTPTSGSGRRGRGGPLEQQTRQQAAQNRADGSCLFHVTRKTKCPRPSQSESSTICESCELSNRICYRLSQKCKESLFIGRHLLSNSKTRTPLLALAGTTALTKQRRFRIEVRYRDEVTMPFDIDQSPLSTQEPGDNQEQAILGSISDKPFFALLESMAPQAQIAERLRLLAAINCHHSLERKSLLVCPIEELLDSVRSCVLIYFLLRRLPDAQLRTPVKDQHAAKCFVVSLTDLAIRKLRDSLKHSTEQLFKAFQNHRKVYSDPSYDRVVTALVALCGLVHAMARSQAADNGGNVMVDAISGALPDAQPFAQELEMLGQGFCAITDPVPPEEGFRLSAQTVLTPDATPRLLIMLDPSGSESSLREEGALTTQSMQSIAPWSVAQDGHSRTRSLPGQPVRALFASNRLTADERRIHRGFAGTPPTTSDSDNDGTWNLLSDPRSNSFATAGPSSDARQPASTRKRERSDSMRTGAQYSERKKAKSP